MRSQVMLLYSSKLTAADRRAIAAVHLLVRGRHLDVEGGRHLTLLDHEQVGRLEDQAVLKGLRS